MTLILFRKAIDYKYVTSFCKYQYKIITEDRINSADLKRNQLNLFKHQNKAETNREILLNSIFLNMQNKIYTLNNTNSIF